MVGDGLDWCGIREGDIAELHANNDAILLARNLGELQITDLELILSAAEQRISQLARLAVAGAVLLVLDDQANKLARQILRAGALVENIGPCIALR